MNRSPNALKAKEHFDKDTAGYVVTVLHEDGEYRHLRFQAPGQRWGSTDIHAWPGGVCTSGDMADGWMFERGLGFFGGESGPNLHYWAEKLNRRGRDEHLEFSEPILRETLAEVPDIYEVPEAHRAALSEELNELADTILNSGFSDTVHAHEELREFSFEYEDDESGLTETVRFEEYYEMPVEDYSHHFVWACLVLNTVVNLLDEHSDRIVRHDPEIIEPPFSAKAA